MERSEYLANLHLATQPKYSRRPTYVQRTSPPVCRLRFIIALAITLIWAI